LKKSSAEAENIKKQFMNTSVIKSVSEKKFKTITWIFTAIVFLLVLIIKTPGIPKPSQTPEWIYILPLFHAILNGTCFLILIASFLSIRKKNVELHRKLNTAAMVLSFIFLISYVIFHILAPETLYGDLNKNHIIEAEELNQLVFPRSIYLFILFTHILLAAITLPFILLAYYFGIQRNVIKHRTITRKVYPLWLYVTLSGVIVYILIRPFY